MHALKVALGYPHRLISPLESALLALPATPFDHSWLAGQHSTNRVLAQAKVFRSGPHDSASCPRLRSFRVLGAAQSPARVRGFDGIDPILV